jgi:hypothetical protein
MENSKRLMATVVASEHRDGFEFRCPEREVVDNMQLRVPIEVFLARISISLRFLTPLLRSTKRKK